MNSASERRRFVRLNILVDVAYTQHNFPKAKKITVTKNISRGGICFVGYDKLEESDVIDLKVYLPPGQTQIVAVGKVVWVKEFTIGDTQNKRYDVGVEFIDINEQDLKMVERYMADHE